jgi:hypothetical protein
MEATPIEYAGRCWTLDMRKRLKYSAKIHFCTVISRLNHAIPNRLAEKGII